MNDSAATLLDGVSVDRKFPAKRSLSWTEDAHEALSVDYPDNPE